MVTPGRNADSFWINDQLIDLVMLTYEVEVLGRGDNNHRRFQALTKLRSYSNLLFRGQSDIGHYQPSDLLRWVREAKGL